MRGEVHPFLRTLPFRLLHHRRLSVAYDADGSLWTFHIAIIIETERIPDTLQLAHGRQRFFESLTTSLFRKHFEDDVNGIKGVHTPEPRLPLKTLREGPAKSLLTWGPAVAVKGLNDGHAFHRPASQLDQTLRCPPVGQSDRNLCVQLGDQLTQDR